MSAIVGILIGFGVWFILRYVLTAFYTWTKTNGR
jgi:hypothetical protein